MFCVNCGAKLKDDAKFCSECGSNTNINAEKSNTNYVNEEPVGNGGSQVPPPPPGFTEEKQDTKYNNYNSTINNGFQQRNNTQYNNSNNDNLGQNYNNANENSYYDNSEIVKYAGFCRRFFAMVIDNIFLSIIYSVVNMVIIAPIITSMVNKIMTDPNLLSTLDSMQYTTNEQDIFKSLEIVMKNGGSDIVILMITASLILGVITWLYFAIMESSAAKATLGKLALGIIVTDIRGNKISFMKATGRYFGKIISGFILCIGYLMAGFTEKKQALHDIMAGCIVVRK